MHTDAAESPDKIAISVGELDVDLLTLAGHQFYTTKGVDTLYIQSGTPIQADLHGGGQGHALRPGTENVPAMVGLGIAAHLATTRGTEEWARVRRLRINCTAYCARLFQT